jgi:hypothetical protein
VGEVLEGDRGPVHLGVLDQSAREHVKSGFDPVPLPPTLSVEQSSAHPSVRRLLPRQVAATLDVPSLDHTDLRERNPHETTCSRADGDSVERRLVGIQGEEGGRPEGIRGRALEEQHHPRGTHVKLLDPDSGHGEGLAVIWGNLDVEGAPYSIPE